jgi:hypothetical protein
MGVRVGHSMLSARLAKHKGIPGVRGMIDGGRKDGDDKGQDEGDEGQEHQWRRGSSTGTSNL